MLRTNRERRRNRDVGKPEIRQNAPDQIAAGFGRGNGLVHVKMQNSPARVLSLQVILHLKRKEGVVRKVHRQLRAVRVIRVRGRARLNDVREALAVFLGKAIGRSFSRRRLEVVHVIRLFLERDELRANVIQEG